MQQIFSQLSGFSEQHWIHSILWAIALAAITGLVASVASHGMRRLVNDDNTSLPSSSILVNIVRVVVWGIGISIILDACFDVNANALVAALGVGGIAVSLGFQDTLSNLIGGLQITFLRIVKPGDNIEVGSESGVVQDVGWRHTTIVDSMGQTVIIPNSIISTTALVHLLPANRVVVPFAIARYKRPAGVASTSKSPDPGSPDFDIDELADELAVATKKAADTVSPVVNGPKVLFSEIAELGIKGKIVFQVQDADQTGAAADAVVRAIASMVG